MIEFVKGLGSFFADGALVFATLFVISYGFFFAWYKTSSGRAIMAFVGSLVALSASSWIYRTFGEFPGYEWVRAIIYGFVFFAAGGLLISLWRTWLNTPIDGVEHRDWMKERG